MCNLALVLLFKPAHQVCTCRTIVIISGKDDDVEGKDDDDVEGMAVEGMVRLSVGMQLEVPTVQGDPVKDRNRLETHFYR